MVYCCLWVCVSWCLCVLVYWCLWVCVSWCLCVLGSGGVDEAEVGNGTTRTCYPSLPVCLPCWPGCRACLDGSPCRVQEDWVLRSVVMAGQGAFMVLVFFSMMAAYRHRRAKVGVCGVGGWGGGGS